jgi:hypothetical protein
MTGPIHIAIALSCGIIGGTSQSSLALMAVGAVLPDIVKRKGTIRLLTLPLCSTSIVTPRAALRFTANLPIPFVPQRIVV